MPPKQTVAFIILAIPMATLAAPTIVDFSVPSLDRWNYPFNASPGFRPSASTFSAVGFPDFDDRDGEFLVGFDTASIVPASQGPANYDITQALMTVTTITANAFRYDPTSDSFETYLDPADPDFIPDADTGRPIELFGASFRNGFTVDTFLEDSPFQQAPFGFWQGTRNSFPTDFLLREARDVSRNVEMRFTPTPFSVGENTTLAPGQLVPSNTKFTFPIDLSNPDALAFLQEALNAGKVRFMVTSIHPAATMGKGTQTYPDYYTKENKFSIPFGFAATLNLSVTILEGSPADLNADGVVNGADLASLLSNWGGAGATDLNQDGVTNGADLASLLSNWG